MLENNEAEEIKQVIALLNEKLAKAEKSAIYSRKLINILFDRILILENVVDELFNNE
jgi:hypothetical protein